MASLGEVDSAWHVLGVLARLALVLLATVLDGVRTCCRRRPAAPEVSRLLNTRQKALHTFQHSSKAII